jgi:ribosomal protein S12 methylthiotransferase accessory factor
VDIRIRFPGGKRVNAEFDGFTVATDQPAEAGGQGSAPAPFAHFLASIGTCAGIYVLGFCQARGIPTEGLELTQRHEWDPVRNRLARVRIDIRLPAGFPDKYRAAVVRAAEHCAVQKALHEPPEFVVTAGAEPAHAAARACARAATGCAPRGCAVRRA